MRDDYDIDFLIERRPRPDAPSQTDTAYARASLIAQAHRTRRHRRTTGALTVGVVVAAIAVGGVMIAGHGSGGTAHSAVALAPPSGSVHHHVRSAPTPLLKLASDVRTMPSAPQPGDATLVVRDTDYDGHHLGDGAGYGGYDLYTDSGRYYYAPDSLVQLQQTYDARDAVPDDNTGAVVRALAAAAGGTPEQARQAAVAGEPDDQGPMPSVAVQHARWAALPAPVRRRFPFRRDTAAGWRAQVDSVVYIDATQALEVGAGRPDVRAGAMKALSTLAGVTQTPTTVDGVRALKVDFPILGGAEIIWLDAGTGVPIQEKDGDDSATTYLVQRVTASRLPSAISPDALLR